MKRCRYTGPYLRPPVHFKSRHNKDPSGVECIQVVEHMGFCVGNAIKYLWRRIEGQRLGRPEKSSLVHRPRNRAPNQSQVRESI
ncbi:MAG: DUF3310 domain-containing protein [Roseobacter sp.]